MHSGPKHELDAEDRDLISRIFEERISPRLKLYHARTGALGCGFAGDAYANWVLHFRSVSDDFEITEFEYDEEARNVDLGV